MPAGAETLSAGGDIAAPPADDIVVSAARTVLPASALPLTVDVVGQEELFRQIAISGSVVDALSAMLPAFSPTQDKINGSGVKLRGRTPLYTIDGVPQSTPIRNDARDGYTIDPFFIDRIEVIYGSNALQGIGATGGVVNQVTVKAPAQDGISGRAMLQGNAGDDVSGSSMGGKAGGLLSYRSGAFDVTGGVAFERRGVFLDGDGKRIGIDPNNSELQDTDTLSFFGRAGVDLSPSTRFEVLASRYKIESNGHYVGVNGNRTLGIPASSQRGETPGTPASGLTQLVSASLVDKDLGGGTFSLMGFYNRTRNIFSGGILATFQDARIAPVGTLFDQSQNKSRKLGAKINYERKIPGIPDLTGTVGFDALFDRTAQSLIQTRRSWVPQTDFRSLAPFGQLNWGLFHGLVRLAGGMRYENVQLDVPDYTTLATSGSRAVTGGKPSFHRALWNGGVVLEPLHGIRVYGSYAEGFTIADIGRVLRGISQANVRIDSFLNLTPVISNNREVGVEIKRGPIEASTSYYWSSSDFGEVLVRGADGFYSTTRQPISLQGLDIDVTTQTPVKGLKLGIGYNHIIGRTDTNSDGRLDADLDGGNISPDRVNLTADYKSGPFTAQLRGRFYLSREFVGQPVANNFAGYALLDASVGYQLPVGQVSLSVQNVTNADYITYLTDTQGPADNARFYSGRGRNFTLTWAYRF
ncbi:TonB-dependent receptor [Sphingomonas sp. AP4-R1]|uniref:TonB-dependent receptor n=1 Tax=Sphingomonas sp. AP4-R1 TaxID=2735134 RepID=UPI0020A25579|nr:TonB-dependent receptor [Sphingomonas sp. AP4-R1]